MELDIFAQKLSLDDESRLAAQELLSKFQTQDQNIYVPAAVYLASINCVVPLMNGEYQQGNGITLTQIIRSLDQDTDIEAFLEAVQEISQKNQMSIQSLDGNIKRAHIIYRLYKKFDHCFSLIEKAQNPSETPKFIPDDISEYQLQLKKVMWIFYIIIKKYIIKFEKSHPFLISQEGVRATLILIATLSVFYKHLPDKYTISKCVDKSEKELISIILGCFQQSPSNLSEEIHYYMNLATHIIHQVFEVIQQKREFLDIDDIQNQQQIDLQIQAKLDDDMIDQLYRQVFKVYEKVDKDELDEECFLRNRIALTPSKRRNEQFDVVEKRVKTNEQIGLQTPLKVNKFSASKEKPSFEIGKHITETPINKTMANYNWQKNQLTYETLEIFHILDLIRPDYVNELKGKVAEILTNYLTRLGQIQHLENIARFFFRVLDQLVKDQELENSNILSNDKFIYAVLGLSIYTLISCMSVYKNIKLILEHCKVTAIDLFKVLQNFSQLVKGVPNDINRHLFDLEKQILLDFMWQTDGMDLIRIFKQRAIDEKQLRYYEMMLVNRFNDHVNLRVKELCSVFEVIFCEDQVSSLIHQYMKTPTEMLINIDYDQLIICTIFMVQRGRKMKPEFKKLKKLYYDNVNHKKGLFNTIIDFYNNQFLNEFKQLNNGSITPISIPKSFLAQSPYVNRIPTQFALGESVESPIPFSTTLAKNILNNQQLMSNITKFT